MRVKQHWLEEKVLKGLRVELHPLAPVHRDPIIEAASDGQLWTLWYTSVPSPDRVDQYIDAALRQKEQGLAMPFVVMLDGQLIGCTRFCNADNLNQRVEIGYTWYAKRHQRSFVNSECKLVLLTEAFEQKSAIAVELRTHWHNRASRAAIERLGAKQDGVLRQHSRDPDGAFRDTVVYSIIQPEWSTVKKSLLHKLGCCPSG